MVGGKVLRTAAAGFGSLHATSSVGVTVCLHARMLMESGTKKLWNIVDASQICTVQPVLKQLEAWQRPT